MKNKVLKLGFLILITLMWSCQNLKQNPPANKVFVAGKMLNFENHKDIKTFRIYLHDIFELQKIISVEVDDSGAFETSIPCDFITDITIRFDRASAFIICAPGDSILLTIDADILNDSEQHYYNDGNFVKVVGVNRKVENAAINDFLKKVVKVAPYSERRNAIKQKEPLEYFDYWNDLYNKKYVVLDSFLAINNSELFKVWAMDWLKYEKLNNLMRYSGNHSRFSKINVDSLYIPDEYYIKIFNEDINEREVVSLYHNYFLKSYYNYFYKQAKIQGLEVLKNISQNATGFPKDVALAKYYYHLAKTSDTLVEVNYDLIENDVIENMLRERIEEEKVKKDKLLNNSNRSPLIDSLFGKYKGKVVYVDFWETTCGVCISEMPLLNELQRKLEDKPVVFLSLCCDSNEKSWRRIIKEKNLAGTNILLNHNQFPELQTMFSIVGFPHYVLINKQGGFINKAPRPGKKILVDKINELLKE